MCFHLCEGPGAVKLAGTESGCQGSGELVFRGTYGSRDCSFYRMKDLGRKTVAMLHIPNVFKTTELYTLKWSRW